MTKKNNSGQHGVLIKLGLAAIIVVIFMIAASALLRSGIWGPEGTYPVNLGAAPRNIKPHLGNINGVPIAVPHNYTYYRVEYKDKSIWEPRKSGDKPDEARTYADAISAFTVYVRWPDMKPRDRAAVINGLDAKTKPFSWLLAEIGAYRPEAVGRDLGWAPVLAGELKRLSPEELARRPVDILDPADPERRRWIKTREPRYAIRGIDAASGLNRAEPVGPGVERFYTWNMALYWNGDADGYVSDFISCYNGTVASPDSTQKCRHQFNLPEFGASVTINYPRDLVPQWREIKSSTTKLILSFKAAADVTHASAP